MAIAYDSAVNGGNNGGSTTTLSFSLTMGSVTDGYVAVALVGDATADDISSVTIAGSAMTLLGKQSGERYRYLYGRAMGTTSGSKSIVVTAASTHYLIAGAASYSGVDQVTPQNGATVTTATTATSQTATITTTVDNAWAVMGCYTRFTGGNTPAAGSGSTRRTYDAAFGDWALMDSNGPVTPAGSKSLTWTAYGSSDQMASLLIALAPTSVSRSSGVLLRGVG